MDGFKNILYPVDLAETSLKIIPFVRTMADKFQAKIHLLNVVQDLENLSGFYVPHPSLEIFAKELNTAAQEKLRQFHDEHMADMPDVEYATILGDPAEQIVKYVKDQGIDLIIMGTHGKKGLDKLIFGSVAEKVVKMSPVPVLTINPHKV